MKSSLHRRIARLQIAALEMLSTCSEPVSCQSFLARVEQRRRLTGESFNTATEALVVQLSDSELEVLTAEAESDAASNLLSADGQDQERGDRHKNG